MGNTIGYLRKGNKSDNSHSHGTSTRVAKVVSKQWEKHEYQSISDADDFRKERQVTSIAHTEKGNPKDTRRGETTVSGEQDDFSSPLDFGPSLTEEVFGELNSAVVYNQEKSDHSVSHSESILTKQSTGKSESQRDLRGFVG